MKNIKKLREERGISQKQLAQKSELAQSFISYIEKKKTNPSLDTLRRLAKGLDVSVEYLLND